MVNFFYGRNIETVSVGKRMVSLMEHPVPVRWREVQTLCQRTDWAMLCPGVAVSLVPAGDQLLYPEA